MLLAAPGIGGERVGVPQREKDDLRGPEDGGDERATRVQGAERAHVGQVVLVLDAEGDGRRVGGGSGHGPRRARQKAVAVAVDGGGDVARRVGEGADSEAAAEGEEEAEEQREVGPNEAPDTTEGHRQVRQATARGGFEQRHRGLSVAKFSTCPYQFFLIYL